MVKPLKKQIDLWHEVLINIEPGYKHIEWMPRDQKRIRDESDKQYRRLINATGVKRELGPVVNGKSAN